MPDLFTSVIVGSLTLSSYLYCVAVSFLCGIICAAASSFRSHISKSFLATLVLLPPVVATVIMMVNGNVGTGIAVAGAFSLVRFRSVAGKAREIASVFTAMAAGLACASGYVWIALIFAIILGVATVLLALVPVKTEREMDLRLTIPETLNYVDVFDDLFKQYTKRYRLVKVKTVNMGSLYKLTYKIEMKNTALSREFIDKLRCRNGNLEITLAESVENGDEL
ncbi:MAG: DUF4956 domain-containing protein [Clostridia bacterium]|nr:DUF4956 domain-containing protein [Clostridia bacterium]